jgi:hypothetical protein
MGDIRPHPPVVRFLAVFSRYEQALDWARTRMVEAWGPIALESQAFEFVETTYYEESMGTGLRKVLFAFRDLVDPEMLVDCKLLTNQWEEQYARDFACPETRPLNLDPGYVTEAKLVLASTKDRDHRIYLSRGIFAENTLFFRSGQWQARPWTYPDYQRADYREFLMKTRQFLRQASKRP